VGERKDTYGYEESDLERFERFVIEPVRPEAIEERRREAALETLDVPRHLGRKLVVGTGTGNALYRLVQLFGTPNVPGLEAGATSRERGPTTWQYLFAVTYEPGPDEDAPTDLLLSIYDYKTDVSTGLSAWSEEKEAEPGIRDPVETKSSTMGSIPDAEFLETVVQLVLNIVEEPVSATYEELWV
jgi:hypothetical protein